MRDFNKFGPFGCGRIKAALRFSLNVSGCVLILTLGGRLSGSLGVLSNSDIVEIVSGVGRLWGLLGSRLVVGEAQAAICFLPDCMDKADQVPSGNLSSRYCKDLGYVYYPLGQCPQFYARDVCPYDSYYLKCDAAQWCADNGYGVKESDCTIPEYADEQCPNGLEVFKECKADYGRACREENEDYVSSCSTGWKLDNRQLCSYSDKFGICCNTCVGYDYTAANIPSGYIAGKSCQACGGVTKYQKEISPCEGYRVCSEGGKTGAATCMHGSEKWYKECCSACDDYPYTAMGIPVGYLKGDSCESCSGLKYKTKAGSCASGYVWNGNSCSQDCKVGNILNSDMSCSASKVADKTPIGVVSYINGNKKLAISLVSPSRMSWSGSSADISGIANWASESAARTDFDGKSNTAAWVRYFGSSVTNYAAGYCYNYSTSGTFKGDWYLPALGELYVSIVTNYQVVKKGLSAAGGTSLYNDRAHWSSSEYGSGSATWNVAANMNNTHGTDKTSQSDYVRCVFLF